MFGAPLGERFGGIWHRGRSPGSGRRRGGRRRRASLAIARRFRGSGGTRRAASLWGGCVSCGLGVRTVRRRRAGGASPADRAAGWLEAGPVLRGAALALPLGEHVGVVGARVGRLG